MNKILIYLSVLILVLISCKKKEFDTNGEYKEITVIYGLIDINETKQYIKVGKGYQNIGTNALEMAQNDPNATLYLDSIFVTLEEKNGIGTVLNKVNLKKEFISNKDDGVFNSNSNYWYTFDTSDIKLNSSNRYTLNVTNTITGKISGAEIGLIKDFCASPYIFDLCDPSAPPVTFLNAKGFKDVQFDFNSAKNAEVYKVYCVLNFSEFVDNDINTKIEKQFKFTISGSEYITYSDKTKGSVILNSENFFNNLVADLDTTNQNPTLKRQFNNLVFTTVAAGPELSEYLKAQAAYSSITQTKPFYTNVYDTEGNPGAGILTSRYFKDKISVISATTIESIKVKYPGFKLN